MEIKAIKEQIVAKRNEMLALHESAKAENRSFTQEEQTKWDATKSEIDTLEKQVKIEEEANELRKINFEKKVEERKTEVKVGENDHKKTKEFRNLQTLRLIQATMLRDSDMQKTAAQELAEGGHIELRDGFSTFKDPKGGVFIPTSVSAEIMELAGQFGVVARRVANRFDLASENIKVPSVFGRPTFTAANEGSNIAGSGFSFGGIELSPLKWGLIIDWTNEIGDAAAARLIPIIQRKVAEAQAYLYDYTVFRGDGTSTYNKKVGYVTLSADSNKNNVKKTAAASGNTAYGTLDAEDWLAVQYDVAPYARQNGVYVMHPDMEEFLLGLKDGNGTFVYGGPATQTDGVRRLWGRPVEFTEAMVYDNQADKVAAAFVNLDYLAYGVANNLSVKELDQATITNEDGSSVNLATSDSMALRFVTRYDFQISDVTITENAVTRGSGSVLYTAGS